MDLITFLTYLLEHFNIGFIITCNILTYIIVNLIDLFRCKGNVSFWGKRVILLISIIIVSVIYYYCEDVPGNVLINSAIAAPVSWSWVLKPICKALGFDYKKIDSCIN